MVDAVSKGHIDAADVPIRVHSPPAPPSGRTLVLCFDGTANEFDDTNTNVVKLFSFLEKHDPNQLVYYQTGIGTYVGDGYIGPLGKWIAKKADLGVAWYLDAHVNGGYKFLQNTWEPGDKICMFGFSRGAYTARALAGMLYTVGLLPRHMPEQVAFAYSIFKNGKRSTEYKRAFSRTVTIDFLGVWDTVSSVGALYPRVLPFSADNHITRVFRHACALDEHRAKFRSNTWHLSIDPEIEEPPKAPEAGIFRTLWDKLKWWKKQHLTEEEEIDREEALWELESEGGIADRPPTDVKEVWFAGCHCDVGGGNAKDNAPYALSNVPLRWMLKEIIAADTGIIFRKGELARAKINYDALCEDARRTVIEDARLRAIKRLATPPKSPAAHHMQTSTSTSKDPVGHAQLPTDATAVEGPIDSYYHDSDLESDTKATLRNEALDRLRKAQAADVPSLTPNPVPDATNPNLVRTTSGKVVDKKQTRRWKDATAPITDELAYFSGWYVLECLPFIAAIQNREGKWTNSPRINFWRPRDIPVPPGKEDPNSMHNKSPLGVNIIDAPALFHISVKERMEAEECNVATWRSFWRKKDVPYRPRAWPAKGEPVWVD